MITIVYTNVNSLINRDISKQTTNIKTQSQCQQYIANCMTQIGTSLEYNNLNRTLRMDQESQSAIWPTHVQQNPQNGHEWNIMNFW